VTNKPKMILHPVKEFGFQFNAMRVKNIIVLKYLEL
jgi:hypothetical protein